MFSKSDLGASLKEKSQQSTPRPLPSHLLENITLSLAASQEKPRKSQRNASH